MPYASLLSPVREEPDSKAGTVVRFWIIYAFGNFPCPEFGRGSLQNIEFHSSFSRHGRADASIALLIWLNENVESLFFWGGKRLPAKGQTNASEKRSD